ncbi:MAG TPA: hypothetical protein VFI13_14040, partial [Gemmatimonadales bacterium]|nr:hypothetical protein [Gemmatimonadales bacterium]
MLLQAIPLPPAPPAPPGVEVITSGPPDGVLAATTIIIGMIVVAIIMYPLIRAWARRLEGKAGGGEEARQMEARVVELEHRLADVEERLDFSERMLSQREPVALPR